jgi:hypothetical protein
MAKNNQTALVLTTLATLGLFSLTGAIVWLGLRMQPNRQPPSLSSSPANSPTPQLSEPSDVAALQQVTLESDRKVDYSRLRDALQQQDWRTADRETYERLLDAAGPGAQAQGFTPQNEMNTFSCQDLSTVDQLWSTASNGKFGFTAQQNILRVLGDYRKMYDQVGWQTLSGEWLIEWTYNPQTKRLDYKPGKEPNFVDAPPGHLPTTERGYNFDVSLDAALKRCNF